MDKLSEEKISQMCPKCREAAHDWIVDVTERTQRIVKMSKRLEVLAFVLGASTMFTALTIIAACQR